MDYYFGYKKREQALIFIAALKQTLKRLYIHFKRYKLQLIIKPQTAHRRELSAGNSSTASLRYAGGLELRIKTALNIGSYILNSLQNDLAKIRTLWKDRQWCFKNVFVFFGSSLLRGRFWFACVTGYFRVSVTCCYKQCLCPPELFGFIMICV